MTSLTRSSHPPVRGAFPSSIDDLASALMRSGLVAFAVLNSGNVVASSPALREILGCNSPQQHIDGHSLLSLVAEPDQASVGDFCTALLREDTRIEHRCQLLHADGSAIPVLLSGNGIRVDGAHQIVLVVTDLRPWVGPTTVASTPHLFLGFDRTTGFATYPLLLDRMKIALAAARRHRRRTAVLRIDLERLDALLDGLVVEAAEEVQATIAETLRNCVRDCDTVARLGTREFVLLLPEIGERDDAGITAARVVEAIAHLFASSAAPRRVTATIGVSVYPTDGTSAERLLAHAELAMRAVSGTTEGRFAFSDATNAELSAIGPLQFLEEYTVGVPEIDAEHRELVARTNALVEDLQGGADPGRLAQDVRDITELLRRHFATEARHLGTSPYEGSADLRTRNMHFLDELHCILLHVNRQSVALAIRHLHDWLVPHLLDLDYKMVS
jgi:diguanylate cyclase (GGDEF)-like protein/hemerythrin-like metal-binding protein/PAS domain S-box-containing protein